MYCKFCGAELEENNTLCVSCGQENGEPPRKKSKTPKIVAAVVLCALLLAALMAMVYYGLNGTLKPRENDILYKDNYTVTDEKLTAGAEEIVAWVGEDGLTNGQLQVFYWMQIYNYGYYYDADFTKPLHEQIMDEETGKTWQQYFLESALTSWHQYQALQQLAEQDGYTLPQEYRETLDSLWEKLEKNATEGEFASVEEMLTKDFGTGTSFDSYRKFFDLFYVGNLYFSDLVDKQEATQEEIDAYYAANSSSLKNQRNRPVTKETGKMVDVYHILICPEEETDAGWEACYQKAEDIYNRWLAGEATEAFFIELAQANTEDSQYLYEEVISGEMVETFEAWCMEEGRKYGDHGIVKTEYGYHIMFFVKSYENAWEELCRNGVLSQKADAMLKEILEKNPADVDYKKIVLSNVNISGS